MYRKIARPYGQSVSGMRLVSMLMAMLVLWMLYHRLKDPTTWRAFADDKETASAELTKPTPVESETIIPGPNDQNEDEVADVREMFEFVTDRAPLKPREMDVYWRLMDWSRTQSFADLEKRAFDDVAFTKLWELPEKYRGKLVRLRMHVRRVLKFDAPENPSNIPNVCEAWGWTDESRSFPYVVVFPEPPQDLPIGTDVRAEIIFVGYFMKVMTYAATDNTRGAPLLVGRVQLVSTPKAIAPTKTDPWVIVLILFGGAAFAGYAAWMRIRTRRKSNVTMLPKEFSVIEPFDRPALDNPFAEIVAVHSSDEPQFHLAPEATSSNASPPTESKKD